MIIENLDQLKFWLAQKLEPICDADPFALAKYVIALVKKEKPEAELKALCEDQLDVFLGNETKLFVKDLFEGLISKSYLPATAATKAEDAVIVSKSIDQDQKGKKRKTFEENEKIESEKIVKTDTKGDVGKISQLKNDEEELSFKSSNDTDTTLIETKINNKNDLNKDLNNDKKDNNDQKSRNILQDRSQKSTSPVSSRSSKRSSSHNRRRSSRSPNSRTSSRHSKPSSRPRREHVRRRTRRRNEKEKCRDYEEKGFCMFGEVCPYDHGQDPVEVDDSNLTQMLSLAGIPASQAAQQPQQQQLQAPLQLYPNVIAPRAVLAPGSAPLSLNTGLTTVQVQKPRPIPSPVELSSGQVPIFRPRNPVAFLRNASPPITPLTGNANPVLSNLTPATSVLSKSSPASGEPYNPEEPSISTDKTKMDIDNASANVSLEKNEVLTTDTSHLQKEKELTQNELVQIAMGNVPLTPIVGSSQPNVFQMNGNQPINQTGVMQPQMQQQMLNNPFVPDLLQPAYVPLGFPNQQQNVQAMQLQSNAMVAANQQGVMQVPARQPFKNNTVLEVRKIPAELNNIVRLSEHFQRFGAITKIQTPYENDVQGALIEFKTNKEAAAAYFSPEAILGNRFIKVFWHNPNRQQNKGNNNDVNKQNPADRAPVSVSSADGQQQDSKPKKVATSEELRYVNPKNDPKLIMEKKKELEKMKQELTKKKQSSYDELIKKQKEIYTKLADKKISKDEKARLLKAFKHCDVTAQKLKKELMEDASRVSENKSPVKSYRDPKKEILDREIDIYHGNLEGDELLQAREALEELKREVYGSSRGRGFRGRPRGRGSWYRGRGRGGSRGSYHSSSSTIDNRPKQILVSGYNPDEKDEIVAHFATLGQLDRIEETATDKMVLTFPTRKSAEIAAIQGVEFNGKSLVLAWFTGQIKSNEPSEPGPTIQRRMTRSLSQSLMDKDLDDELLELDKDEEEMLLAGVDDDDDDDDNPAGIESNERSWRR